MGLISRVSSRTYRLVIPIKSLTMTNSDNKTPTQEQEEPKPIDKWDYRQVKNGLDESIKTAISKIFPEAEESYKLIDTRLYLCAICCIICAAACAYDYKHPYPESHNFLIICVVPYGILFAYLSYFMMYVEGNILCVYKTSSDKQTWSIATFMPKYDPTFQVELVKNGKTAEEISFSIGDVIDEDGLILDDLVLNKVQSLVDKVEKSFSKVGKAE